MQEWKQFLIELESELGKDNVDKWLRTLEILKFDARNLYLQAQNSFQQFWFHQYVKPKLNRFKNRNGKPIKVNFEKNNSKKSEKKEEVLLQFDPLDPIFELSNFYISEQNKPLLTFIHELIYHEKKVSLGSINPIFIYGEKASGKTHLLSSIAKMFTNRGYNVLFVHADLFSKHVVFSMRKTIMDQFRKTYRSADLLIVDDVHLFTKKNATQEEFFHTFNYLHTLNKQLLFSSKCPPQELEEIEPRLISRFEWGLSSKLEKLETVDLKEALYLKMDSFQITLKEDLVYFLIQMFPYIEQLTLAFNTLLLRAKILDHLSVQGAKNLLSDLIQDLEQKKITPDDIIHAVAIYFGMKTSDILDRNQKKDFALARQIAMFFLRHMLQYPFTKIGQLFQRDHSTVISSIKKIEEAVDRDSDLKKSLFEIRKTIEKRY